MGMRRTKKVRDYMNKKKEELRDKRRNAKTCILCGGKVNHFKSMCDFHNLQIRVKKLETLVKRIEKYIGLRK